MIIEIDGYVQQVMLTGKTYTKQALRQKYREAQAIAHGETDIAAVFCRLHRFDPIPYEEEIEVDFVIDTDTSRIYTPFY